MELIHFRSALGRTHWRHKVTYTQYVGIQTQAIRCQPWQCSFNCALSSRSQHLTATQWCPLILTLHKHYPPKLGGFRHVRWEELHLVLCPMDTHSNEGQSAISFSFPECFLCARCIFGHGVCEGDLIKILNVSEMNSNQWNHKHTGG